MKTSGYSIGNAPQCAGVRKVPAPIQAVTGMRITERVRAVRWVRRFPVRTIGLILFAFIIYNVGLDGIITELRKVTLGSVLLAVLAFAVLGLSRCLRWHVLVRSTGTSPPIEQNLFACNESIWLGGVTPGRFGEFQRAFELHRQTGRPLGNCSALVLLDLFLDLAIFLLLTGAGLLFLGKWALTSNWIAYGFVVAVGLTALVATLTWTRFLLSSLARLLAYFGATKMAAILDLDFRISTSLQVCLLSLAATLAYVGMVAMLSARFELDLNARDFITMVGLVGVSGALPITYFGFGTREAVLIWYLGLFGHAPSSAVAVSGTFMLALLIAVACAFVAGMLARPLVGKNHRISSPGTEARCALDMNSRGEIGGGQS